MARYYGSVLDGWRAAGHRVDFLGEATFDFDAREVRTRDGVTAVQAGKVTASGIFRPSLRVCRFSQLHAVGRGHNVFFYRGDCFRSRGVCVPRLEPAAWDPEIRAAGLPTP